MKEKIFYEAVEYLENGKGILIDNPNFETDKLRWNRFKTLEDAKQAIERTIQFRKKQYFYFRDKENNLIDKISYYERYPLSYEIRKVVEQEEILFQCDNSDIELREPNTNKKLQEEMPL